MSNNLNKKLGVFGIDKISREGKIYANDYYCVNCYKKGNEVPAEKLWPLFDLDQDTIPKPYCNSCVDDEKLKLLIFLSKGDPFNSF